MKASNDTKVPVKINWEPFFLNQNTPDEGEDLMEHLKNKYGAAAVERFGKPDNPLNRAGERVGIKFNTTRRVINTLKAHRLVEYCKAIEAVGRNMGNAFEIAQCITHCDPDGIPTGNDQTPGSGEPSFRFRLQSVSGRTACL